MLPYSGCRIVDLAEMLESSFSKQPTLIALAPAQHKQSRTESSDCLSEDAVAELIEMKQKMDNGKESEVLAEIGRLEEEQVRKYERLLTGLLTLRNQSAGTDGVYSTKRRDLWIGGMGENHNQTKSNPWKALHSLFAQRIQAIHGTANAPATPEPEVA